MAVQSTNHAINLSRATGPAIGGGNGVTVCYWSNVGAPTGNDRTIGSVHLDDGGGGVGIVRNVNLPDVRLIYNAESNEVTNTHVPGTADTWMFTAFTTDGTNVGLHTRLIGEGALTSQSLSNQADNFTPSTVYLCQSPYNYDGTAEVTARITCVKVWSAVLTTPQILAESSTYNPQVLANLWAFWKCPTAALATVDSSGNSRTLTANGVLTDFADPVGVWSDQGGGNVVAWFRA